MERSFRLRDVSFGDVSVTSDEVEPGVAADTFVQAIDAAVKSLPVLPLKKGAYPINVYGSIVRESTLKFLDRFRVLS